MKTSKLDYFEKIIDILTLIGIPIALWFAFMYAPVELRMGAIQKIFYFHVASAWIGFFAFFVTFIASILFLVTGKYIFDEAAESSAVVGVIFCTIVIVTGPMWAKPTWGVYWTWDPRLTSTLILWFIYLGYIMLRKFVEGGDKKAKFSAAVGIVGFIDVPIVFLSIRWWRSMHPNVVQHGGGGIDSRMLTALFVCLFVFTILYVCMMIKKLKLSKLEKRIKNICNW